MKRRIQQSLTSKNSRTSLGSVLLEFVSVVWMLCIGAVVGVNCGLLAFAAGINEAACREAARAAADQDSELKAKTAACAAVLHFRNGAIFMTSPEVETGPENFEYQTFPDASGRPQRERCPFVRVTTRTVASIPVPLIFTAAGMTGQLVFRKTYTFPILHLNTNAPT